MTEVQQDVGHITQRQVIIVGFFEIGGFDILQLLLDYVCMHRHIRDLVQFLLLDDILQRDIADLQGRIFFLQ